MSTLRFFSASLLTAVVAALSASPTHGADRDDSLQEIAHVVVQNNSMYDTHVYALQEGHMVPLGLVASLEEATLALPAALVDSGETVQLAADPLGTSDWHLSDPVVLSPPDALEFTIENDLEQSVVRAEGTSR